MADESTRRTSAPGAGWLIVRRDGIVVTAEPRACGLLGAPDPDALAGREWASLVAPESPRSNEARRALATGAGWQGPLLYRYAHDETVLETAVEPLADSGGLMRVHLQRSDEPSRPVPSHPRERVAPARPDGGPTLPPRAPAPPETPSEPVQLSLIEAETSPAEDDASLRAQLAAHDALRDLDEPGAAARAVLQALAGPVAFDWGVVLQVTRGETTAVAVYPSPMAGIGPGARWPAGRAEAETVEDGTPSMAGDLDAGPGTPLDRLPAFGLRSRILVPLYEGSAVAGVLALYRSGPRAFDARAGIVAERTARRLGEHLRAPAEAAPPRVSSPHHAPSPPAGGPVEGLPASRLESLGSLVAGVAHELNNPLTAILGYAQILGSLDDEERVRALLTIEEEAQRAARIVRNLLAFARQRPGERHPTDIEGVLRRIIELRRYSMEVDNVRVTTRFGHVPEVWVDEGQFEQAFLNLLNNAHQALQGRGGEVVIGTSLHGNLVRISFADDGPGVPAGARDRVFEPFFTTHDVGAGEGMGLSIVYGVVTNHGGRTWVEPSPSGGANFIVEIPVGEGQTRLQPLATAIEPPSRVGGRILVVDDEVRVLTLTQTILAAHGYQVEAVPDGRQALERLERGDYSMVITDLRMPGMSGIDLYHEIQARWPEMKERVLFVTGDIEGDRGSRTLDRNQVQYLEKPYTTQQLVGAIRRILG